MNHDATHCKDYDKKKCPKNCYRAELTEALKTDNYHYPVSFAHYFGTKECKLVRNKE